MIGTDTLYKTVLGERENIVIIGMPGCGKTVFGRKLSRKTGKKFFDTDILIYERCGIRAGEIIEKYGEARFREIESDVLRELCRKSGETASDLPRDRRYHGQGTPLDTRSRRKSVCIMYPTAYLSIHEIFRKGKLPLRERPPK